MLDTQDPNDVRNYSPEDIAKALPVSQPSTEEDVTVTEHPLLKSMLALLKLYPYIGVWTLMNDKLSHSVEIRIKLFLTEDGSSESSKSNRPFHK